MLRRLTPPLALAMALVACADSSGNSPPTDADQSPPSGAWLQVSPETERLAIVARYYALALGEPGFRQRLLSQLKASRFAEGKLPFRRTVEADNEADVRAMARAAGEPVEAVRVAIAAAPPLEVYLPVPEHRSAWRGDHRLLVATAAHDGEIPVAFDLEGGRHLLDPTRPPFTPVLAVVPAETDFDAVASGNIVACPPDMDCSGGGGSTTPPASSLAPGLYMTAAKFNSEFEGWLKGSPEFEIHVMGQKGSTDSLTKLRCAGENQPSPYRWDGSSSWSGRVMLISQPDLDAFHLAHPKESVRIIALEDDDTSCEMKVDRNLWVDLVGSIGPVYNDVTGAIDSGSVGKYIKAARSVRNFLAAAAALIKTNDDLIGNAIEDQIANQYKAGYNWVLKTEGANTNGWIKLEMN